MSFVVLLCLLLTGVILGWSLHALRNLEPRSKKPSSRPSVPAPPVKTPIDRAYDALDRMEEGQAVPPIRSPLTAAETPVSQKIDDPDFPCNWLSKEPAPGFTPAQCRGICYQPTQRGKLCFWASQAASQCPEFRPRVHARPAPKK